MPSHSGEEWRLASLYQASHNDTITKHSEAQVLISPTASMRFMLYRKYQSSNHQILKKKKLSWEGTPLPMTLVAEGKKEPWAADVMWQGSGTHEDVPSLTVTLEQSDSCEAEL